MRRYVQHYCHATWGRLSTTTPSLPNPCCIHIHSHSHHTHTHNPLMTQAVQHRKAHCAGRTAPCRAAHTLVCCWCCCCSNNADAHTRVRAHTHKIYLDTCTSTCCTCMGHPRVSPCMAHSLCMQAGACCTTPLRVFSQQYPCLQRHRPHTQWKCPGNTHTHTCIKFPVAQ